MHEFFAGSGLVAYGLKGMFAPVWANDVSEQKAAVYAANFLYDHFELDDIICRMLTCRGPAFPAKTCL